MTDQTLAQLSNLAIYSAMVVLTLAMLADAVYLARLVPGPRGRPGGRRASASSSAAGGARRGPARPAPASDADGPGARRAR